MNENTIKAIEEQLRLKSERLALREKEFGLSAKKWRGWGTALAIVAFLGICGMAVCFGGIGLYKLSGEVANMSVKRQPENNESEKQKSLTTLSNNSLVVVFPKKGENVIVKTESNMISDRWALVTAIIVHGVLVISGLAVAAFTVKKIANYNNELE